MGLIVGDMGDVIDGGDESGGVIGHAGKKFVWWFKFNPIDDASWALSWIGHDAIKAAAAAVWFANNCGANNESADGLKHE